MPSSSNSTSLRDQLMTIVSQILIALEAEPAHRVLVIVISYWLGEERNRLKFQSLQGEPAKLLGWGARLSEDDIDVLRALAEAPEPMMARGIARAVGVDPESSTLRERLGPKGPLRAGGYMEHSREEGYRITDKGRNALESSPE